ncbi:MAG TPA: beta-galactosidase trimerization domain-containing protein [Flavisolibacter sp.]|nr:beta-galactosidase trimerization domain-containing protein [Flavisolibacter sp.]
MKRLKTFYDPNAMIPQPYAKRRAALLYNADNRWEMDNQPQTNQWAFMDHLKRYYNALKQLGAPVDVITEEKDFSKYPVLVAPAYQLLDAQLVERWKQYVQNGGHLILSSRTGQKDRNGKLWAMQWAQPIHELIGAKIPFYDLLPDTVKGTITFGAKRYNWNNWADMLEPFTGTQVWATYSNQYYAGKAAIVHRKLGKGTVTFVGADTDDGALEKAAIRKVYQQAGIATGNFPDGVMVDWRDGFWVAVNYSGKPYILPIPANAKLIIGSKALKTADVVVWKE